MEEFAPAYFVFVFFMQLHQQLPIKIFFGDPKTFFIKKVLGRRSHSFVFAKKGI